MTFTLIHFSIADIAHHGAIDSVTGKVKFQFADHTDGQKGLDQFVVLDIAVPATDAATLAEIKRAMMAKAMAVLHVALGHSDPDPSPHRPGAAVLPKFH